MKPCRRTRPVSEPPFDRRAFLRATAALTGMASFGCNGTGDAGGPVGPVARPDDRVAPDVPARARPAEQARPKGVAEAAGKSLGIPGPFPGQVVEVHHPGSVRAGVPQADAVLAMVRRGMTELTGITDPVEAWRSMFQPGDVVGIKVNPVGKPLAISNYATIHAIVDGLRSAGIKPSDIIVFDRYKDMFIQAGYVANLPDGCLWDWAAETYDEKQLDIARYDPDVFATLEIAHARVHDPKDDRTRHSHVAKVVTQKVNKLICIPVLKDHGTGGVTLALKNMSHGLVNNVSRSHGTPETNTNNIFIPTIVSLPVIREKAVLHVLDGLNAVFHRGPNAAKEYVWSPQSLFFATDPVAVDRVGWELVDAKRVGQGLPPVAEAGRIGKDPTHTEMFDMRQPQHIAGAGALGLGVYDKDKIKHRVIRLT